MSRAGISSVLKRYPEGVKWHNDRRQRLLNLAGALCSTTAWITLALMLGVTAARFYVGGPETALEWAFLLTFEAIIAFKLVPASFNLWRMLLWSGRAVFRPRGTQTFQMVATSIGTLVWVSTIVAFAVRFAKPFIGFVNSLGLSISV